MTLALPHLKFTAMMLATLLSLLVSVLLLFGFVFNLKRGIILSRLEKIRLQS